MVVDSTEATGVMDIYAAAGLERPRLDALTPAWMEEAAAPSKAEMAIEGLRTDLLKEATRVTGGNEIRRAQFSERINAVMAKYTNQQLTAAEVIAELVEMAKEVVAEADRGRRFTPPLHDDELMFYDVVAQNEAARRGDAADGGRGATDGRAPLTRIIIRLGISNPRDYQLPNVRTNMSRLIIIGNGFDLHHGLPTSVEDYRAIIEEAGS
ncbi:type I restriction enzyme endonuclease domain-containing protein, partial [Streptococcus pneumoniae]|uniref:type I restriction enzyme endonuclease domain-containing protein n=1 Tax=Streptococcus pneumoniae TaxID=1313 RepID=UPI000A7C9A7F